MSGGRFDFVCSSARTYDASHTHAGPRYVQTSQRNQMNHRRPLYFSAPPRAGARLALDMATTFPNCFRISLLTYRRERSIKRQWRASRRFIWWSGTASHARRTCSAPHGANVSRTCRRNHVKGKLKISPNGETIQNRSTPLHVRLLAGRERGERGGVDEHAGVADAAHPRHACAQHTVSTRSAPGQHPASIRQVHDLHTISAPTARLRTAATRRIGPTPRHVQPPPQPPSN